jgi:hypothetical protein
MVSRKTRGIERCISQRLCISGIVVCPTYDTSRSAGQTRAPRWKLADARSIRRPVMPAWCDQIPTPGENQLHPYSGHSCAHCRPHGFGKLFIERRQITESRSCYEYHPPGPSKTVRTAVGRSIFQADSFGRPPKPAAGERDSADCRACQIKRKTRRVEGQA